MNPHIYLFDADRNDLRGRESQLRTLGGEFEVSATTSRNQFLDWLYRDATSSPRKQSVSLIDAKASTFDLEAIGLRLIETIRRHPTLHKATRPILWIDSPSRELATTGPAMARAEAVVDDEWIDREDGRPLAQVIEWAGGREPRDFDRASDAPRLWSDEGGPAGSPSPQRDLELRCERDEMFQRQFDSTPTDLAYAIVWGIADELPLETPPPSDSCTSLRSSSQLRSLWFDRSGAVLDTDGPGGRIDIDSHPSDRNTSNQAIYWDAIDQGAYTFLNYWFFYRYNDSYLSRDADLGSMVAGRDPLLHEGDWEGMNVALDAETQRMEWAGFDAHGDRWRYLPGVLNCGPGDGTPGCDTTQLGQRLRTFVAYGSHASYPERCVDDDTPIIELPRWPCWQTNETGQAGLPGIEPPFGGEIPWSQNRNAASLKPLPGSDSWANWPGNWNSTAEPSVTSPRRKEQSIDPLNSSKLKCSPRWSGLDAFPCPPPNITSSSSRSTPPLSRSQLESCLPWFGLLVNTLACRPETARVALKSGTIPRAGTLALSGGPLLETDSGRGLAQATGDPLEPGDTLKVKGLGSGGTILLVRARDAGGPSGVWVVTPASVRRAFRGSKTPDETVTLRFSSAGRGRLVAQGTGAVIARGPVGGSSSR